MMGEESPFIIRTQISLVTLPWAWALSVDPSAFWSSWMINGLGAQQFVLRPPYIHSPASEYNECKKVTTVVSFFIEVFWWLNLNLRPRGRLEVTLLICLHCSYPNVLTKSTLSTSPVFVPFENQNSCFEILSLNFSLEVGNDERFLRLTWPLGDLDRENPFDGWYTWTLAHQKCNTSQRNALWVIGETYFPWGGVADLHVDGSMAFALLELCFLGETVILFSWCFCDLDSMILWFGFDVFVVWMQLQMTFLVHQKRKVPWNRSWTVIFKEST